MVTTTTGRATDFITFSRTSNATVTDSNGLIKWAGHNLLTNSESFDASAWTKSSATVTANSEAAPNNTTTGDTIAASGANGTALQSYTALAVPYTFSVWLKRKTGTGTIEIAADNGTYTAVTITSSWALYTVTQTPAAGSKSAGIRIVSSGDEVYAWGAHLYRSDLGGMVLNPARGDAYYPTTPRNLLGFTESLTTGWTNTNTTDSIVTETNPNGLASSVEVTATAGNGTLLGSLSLLASPYTFSIWLKRKTGTGTVEITVDGTTYVTAAVTSDWQRFSTTLTPSAGTKTPGIRLVTSGDAVYAWGAQLSNSASLDAYSPVYGAAVTSAAYYAPRLDFDANGSALGLLVEEQRTNIATHSSEFDNSTFWPRADVDVTANATAAPDGTTTADKLIASATTANHLLNRTNFITVTNGLSYTHSIYAKASEYAFIRVQFQASGFLETWANFNLTTGAVGLTNGSVATSIRAVGNGWYRCSVSATATANGNSGMQLFVLDSDRGGSSPSYLGNGTSGIFIWGAQVETSASFPTSFIPTVGNTTATRTADVASVSTQAFPYSSTAGTYIANFRTLYSGSHTLTTSVVGGDASGSKLIIYIPSGNQNARSFDGSTVISATGDVTGQVSKVSSGYNASGRTVCINGGTVATGTVAAGYASVSTVNIGGESANGLLNGWFRQLTYIPRLLTDAEQQSRTAA